MAGMGCTATVRVAAGSRAAMAHVGDTRLYLVRGGRAHQLSSDHTLAAELVRQGSLSPEHEQSHPYAHVLTRAIGTQALVEVETLTFDLAIGDRLVLCSDGLGDYIPDRQWLVERVVGRPLESLPRGLIDFAIGAGGHDNVTVVVADVTGEDDTSSPEPLDTEKLLNVVGTSYLFSDLTLAQLSRVLQRGRVVDFAPGAVIHRGGELLGDLLLVVAGEVQVQSPSGSVVVGTGQHLGESVVLRPRVVESSIVAGGAPVTILALDEPAIVDLANRRPWLGATLLRRLAQRRSGSDEGTVSL